MANGFFSTKEDRRMVYRYCADKSLLDLARIIADTLVDEGSFVDVTLLCNGSSGTIQQSAVIRLREMFKCHINVYHLVEVVTVKADGAG